MVSDKLQGLYDERKKCEEIQKAKPNDAYNNERLIGLNKGIKKLEADEGIEA